MRTNVAGPTRMVAASAQHVGEFPVDAVVVVDDIRGWSAEPGGAGLQVRAATLAEETPSLVDPEGGHRLDLVTGVVARGDAGGVPDLEERQPGDGDRVPRMRQRAGGGVAHPNGQEGVRTAESRPITGRDPGDEMVQPIGGDRR
jgi:hypothetical protein